jgi:exodeoxyribonuclease V beta subunit
VIEAGAGTGKTYAIEHLVLDLLLRTDSSIEQILVVTFTEKATEELRSRIRTLLEKVVAGWSSGLDDRGADPLPNDDMARRKLETALFSFDSASIFTIHAFCRRMLSDLAFDTGTSFGLELVDSHRAFHRAFRTELREVLTVEDSCRTLLDEWMTYGETARHPNLVDSLEDLLRQSHFNRYLESDERARNDRAISELAETYDPALFMKLCARKNKRLAADVVSRASELASLIRHHRDSPEQLRVALGSFDFEALPYRAIKTDDPREARLAGVLEAARLACSLDVRVVDTYLPRVGHRLRSEKLRNNEIDYGDMLEWLWASLESARGRSLLSLLRGRFRFGLIDEFQDTDDLQWKIFRKIFVESNGANILYVVGDPKQAIYAFRGADVFTYLDARQEILGLGGALVKLVENYRSTGDLIEALNRILEKGAQPPLFSGEIGYDTPVTCGRTDLRSHDPNGNAITPVTLLKYCPDDAPASAARLRASIGRRIASEIRRLLVTGPRITISDSSSSGQVEARDIYVLTRSGAEAIEIGGYLREQGVPFAFYKKEGLFQTSEAYDVLDVLNAIEEPDSHSKRLKAWVSPFFAVPYPDLFDCGEVEAGHPLNERLYEWNILAEEENFGALFDQLVHRSGLVSRELFLANSERELTNYLHIFETLLEQTVRERLSLREIISRLESFIAGAALPAGIESNSQRMETDRAAVQIMSVHMSKGLQADVVFLFGGTVQPPMPPRVCVYHNEKRERRIAVGAIGRTLGKAFIDRETREENERLAYVAITRARAKVYLPVYPAGSTKRRVNGYYEPLNDRLSALSLEIDRGEGSQKLFERIDVRDIIYDAESVSAKVESRLATWSPPASLLSPMEDARPERLFDALRFGARPMQTRSYTSLEVRPFQTPNTSDVELEDFKYDLETPAETADLKGGRRVGIFLHEVIEKLDLESFERARNLNSWKEQDEVRKLFTDTMRRNGVMDPRWFERGTEIVFNALTSPIALPAGNTVGALYRRPSVREMEFVFPMPERIHALLDSMNNSHWTAERGYLKGFVDLVFEHDGLHYFADWKSDSLTSYDRSSIESHVREHYELQAGIYSVGIVRLLGITSRAEYDQRFGGLLYLFIRGTKRDNSGEGVYFQRPDWTEICLYERALIGAIPEVTTPR